MVSKDVLHAEFTEIVLDQLQDRKCAVFKNFTFVLPNLELCQSLRSGTHSVLGCGAVEEPSSSSLWQIPAHRDQECLQQALLSLSKENL